ncbi:DUF3299 domain-containing protein [Halopseudomonas phragmitis]|uniref:DUF3299 domain-containing protein n=2 Tax=Pseudomonadaceae TaxID=135621 RepID=A0A1V0B1L7_9GAMM|nr:MULTISPECIES: DUF3299 domain-containing protein [Pseudomonadaceae]AQZ93826.1 hypothetical protein BVH74_03225 [Halopseudomonas phragmitis]RHW19944.1 DUF3299 domain-containing protein [Pseudomonas jilinensis]
MRILAALLATTLLSANSWAVEELTWGDLVPPEARDMLGMPAPVHDLSQLADALGDEFYGDPAVQVEPAAPVVPELDGRQVRLPGYVVPLGITERGEVDEFLLVPYFGACIHVPPPPSNQIVYVKSSQGIPLQDLYQPFWITGPMQVEHMESDLANAGYRIAGAQVEPYTY